MTEQTTAPQQPRVLKSEDIFQGQKEVRVLHNSEVYLLRITKLNKLILNK